MRLVGGGRSGGADSSADADAPDVGCVASADGVVGVALVERAQHPASVALDEEPDDDFLAASGVANRDKPKGARAWVFRYRRDGKPGAVKADDARGAALPSSPARMAAANPFAFLLPADTQDVHRRALGMALSAPPINLLAQRQNCFRRIHLRFAP